MFRVKYKLLLLESFTNFFLCIELWSIISNKKEDVKRFTNKMIFNELICVKESNRNKSTSRKGSLGSDYGIVLLKGEISRWVYPKFCLIIDTVTWKCVQTTPGCIPFTLFKNCVQQNPRMSYKLCNEYPWPCV